MKKLILYNQIIQRYRNGEFGDKNLTLAEIFDKAGEHNLLDQLSLDEIDSLSSGMLRSFLRRKKEFEKSNKI